MNYTLTPEQLCLLRLSQLTWERQEMAKSFGLSYSEETITENLLVDLKLSFPGHVEIHSFNTIEEGQNGADWAWAFVNNDGSYILPMLVQAKKLNFDEQSYKGIKQTIGQITPPIRQIDQLIHAARNWGWPAIYAFYNHVSDVSRVPANCQSLATIGFQVPESWGVSIAVAESVRAALDDQSFDTHKRHSIALHCLLCSKGTGMRDPMGSPGAILKTLTAMQADSDSASKDGAALPSEPLREMPALFKMARELADAPPGDRQRGLEGLSKEFGGLDGVVILTDPKTPPRE